MTLITPATLSLELGVDQKRIRDQLRALYGTLAADRARWELDEDQAAAVRARFREQGSGVTTTTWTLEVGDTVRRRELHAAYGGQEQGGIITPRSIPDILVITSAESGARHGYDAFEGLQEDGSFSYTGEGQYGPQQFVRGNAALRDAARDGRPIRLFTKQATFVTYVGEFTTGEPPYRPETIPDSDGNLREGIIFNLVPVAADIEALDPRPRSLVREAQVTSWVAPESTPYWVDERTTVDERVVSRIEFELQADFGAWLQQQGQTPNRLLLRSAGTMIEPDMYVPESGWVIEAKKSTARGYVRTAIGQVLDYARVARGAGIAAVPVVLLPGRPIKHLESLMSDLGIILVVRDEGSFSVAT
ncbi:MULTISPECIES: hypothetical protein [unclassified Microbacterium]|uniref:hypothetical protein n=1 Tax=unclassified Microbacterium TaxID=2609290 RepID=UPI000EA9DBE2|nr:MULTISPECIES: hypothetical protein [unclassified Microbacterium]MBT2484279.1 hypothetical protein [Microbacterium sp. ISL-108]RKN67200.1 hypothetical protein D7252_06145 [Microbacterium sp. CGR2]